MAIPVMRFAGLVGLLGRRCTDSQAVVDALGYWFLPGPALRDAGRAHWHLQLLRRLSMDVRPPLSFF